MKLMVDEMPCFPDDDCMFSRQEWDYENDIWITYCKLTGARCDLDEGECSCLKEQRK